MPTESTKSTKKKNKSEQEELAEQNALRQKISRWWNGAESARRRLDPLWFTYDLWVGGYHYAKWDTMTNAVVSSPKTDGRPKVVINKIYTTLRAVRNYVVRNRPRAEVSPHQGDQEPDTERIIKLNQFLNFFHDRGKLRRKSKSIVWDALCYSIGIWQVLWDEEADTYSVTDGKGEIVINEVDPYDWYPDPTAKSEEDLKFCFIAVVRKLEEVMNDTKYDAQKMAKIKPDKKLAASSFKERMLSIEGGSASNDSPETCLVKECWHWELVDKEGEAEEKKEGEEVKQGKDWAVFVTTMIGEEIVRHEKTKLNRLPFFIFASDVKPRSFYGQGWVKNLISPNRELDRVVSHIAEWNHIMNRGKWIEDKGAGVKIINNENGQIIQKRRGYEVKQAVISPLSMIAFSLKEAMDGYMEDIGGFHEASMGRIPPGARSGDAIESLQQGDANNMSELVENFEEFLENVYEYVLELAGENYQYMRMIVPTDSLGQRSYVGVIGESAPAKPDNAIVIPKKTLVDVKIGSWLAETPDARQEKAGKLFELGALDEQGLLEFYNVGNIADILFRLKKKKDEDQQSRMSEEAAMKTMDKEINAEPVAQAGAQEAVAAVRSLVKGEQPIIPGAISPEFVEYLDSLINDPNLPNEIIDVIQRYRDQVVQTAGGSLTA